MGLRKPTNDAYRVQTAIDNAAFGPAAAFICCRAKLDVLAGSTLYWGLNSNVRGYRLDIDATGLLVRFQYVGTAPSNITTNSTAHGVSVGEWAWFFGGVDAAGNIVVGANDVLTTASAVAPKVTGDIVAPTLLNRNDGSGFRGLGTLADFRFYGRMLSQPERMTILHSQGRDGIVNGLVSHLRHFDAAPGVDTDAVVPIDAASPGRSWVVAGVGDAYIHASSPFPLRRVA